MHELSIAKELVTQINDNCEKNNLKADEIILELGSLTSFKKEPIIHYYNLI